MATQTIYEWKVEWLDEDGDVVDGEHFNTLVQARDAAADPDKTAEYDPEICLVRDVYRKHGELLERGHAYFGTAGLDSEFDCGAKVPARFIKEAAK